MEEEDDLVSYKDISELKKELEFMRGKKDISIKEVYDSVQKLSQTMTEILDIFRAAAEQMKLEEKEYESSSRKHETIISKLDKLIDQNKTIAEGMVALVETVKEETVKEEPVAHGKYKEELLFKPKTKDENIFRPSPEARNFMKPAQPEWRPKPEPMMPRPQPLMSPLPPPPMSTSDFVAQMPSMEPTPFPDLDFPEDSSLLEEGPKRKSLFGMFKK